MIKKDAEKILKHKDLITEIQRMWNVIAKVILVIIWATGIISKSFRQYLSKVTGKHEIKELSPPPKKVYWAHCTHTTESANVKVQNIFSQQNNITCSTT